jgi:prepilin-type N-terminal cleavage/methylation domain-containing protein
LRPKPSNHRQIPGFTLIELLVVIAIVSALISILLPSLKAARETAGRLKCLAGARQTGVLIEAYCSDFRDYYPGMEYNTTPGYTWHRYPYHVVLTRLGYATGSTLLNDASPTGNYSSGGIFTNKGGCPHGPNTFNNSWSVNAYQDPSDPFTTYGMNPYLQFGYGNPPNNPSSWNHWGRYKRTSHRITKYASQTPLAMCLVTPYQVSDVGAEAYEAIRSTLGKNWMNVNSSGPRHRGEGLNAVQADGSGQFLRWDVDLSPYVFVYPAGSKMYGWMYKNAVAGLDN